jgi:hypothetical protein
MMRNRFNGHPMGWMFKIFPVLFVGVFLVILIGVGVNAYLAYSCYTSGDRDSMACYFMADRIDHTVRIK